MESQKIINLLDSNDNELQKFATKRWYIINDQNTGNNAYGNGEDGTTIKFETKVIKPNLCDCSDAYILVTGNIHNKPANSIVAFTNCAPFRTCDVTINDEPVENAEDLDIVMPMYNLLEYSDNYQDSTGSLYPFKRDEPPDDNANVANDTTSLVYKSKLISGTDDNNINNVKLVVPLKYASNFFRSSEMPLVNFKIDLELTWHKDCMISSADAATGQVVSFMITDTKLYVPIATLSTKDNTSLTKQLNETKVLKELLIGINMCPNHFQKPHTKKLALLDFLLIQLFKVLTDYLFLLLKILVQMKLLTLLHHEI